MLVVLKFPAKVESFSMPALVVLFLPQNQHVTNFSNR